MNCKRISFKTEDNAEMVGILYTPVKKTNEIIISVHGMTSNCLKKRDEIIAKKVTKNNVAYMCFNNRGHDIVSYIKFKMPDGTEKKELGGTAYEEILDSYYDVTGAIYKACTLGYDKIHLQGHSLGCTKIIYTYQRLLKENKNEVLNKIKSVILLSLVDIPNLLKIYLGSKYQMILDYTKNKIVNGEGLDFMPSEVFIHPISVKTYARYLLYNDEINFAQYSNELYDFKELNEIKANLYMRWGTINELIAQKPEKLIDNLRNKIKSDDKKKVDINFITGANHSYDSKLDVIADEITNFIK